MIDDGAHIRRSIRIRGIVQGVGFRPFVHNLASELGLGGFVRNDPDGVIVQVEGVPEAVETFQRTLISAPPPLARIDQSVTVDIEPVGEQTFRIVASEQGAEHSALVAADVATCGHCISEITSGTDRRSRYAFTNCTNCGPRFTITLDVPYDRRNTTMSEWSMCSECEHEYNDPRDRRFHAQPIACPKCGPQLRLTHPDGRLMESDPIQTSARLLAEGKVVAIKGIGGFHIAVDATNAEAVATLRARKLRDDKPFAVMARDPDLVRAMCELFLAEAVLLSSYRRPVVLLAKLPESPIAEQVAPHNRYLGVMLPYSPLHHLLLEEYARSSGRPPVLVMTSGNVSDEPIAFDDADAYERLAGIADFFLIGERRIHVRVDDTVTRAFRGREYPIRRARGYAPEPLGLAIAVPKQILAVGAELKNTFCYAKGDRAFVSQHIGDLANWETMKSWLDGLAHYARIFDIYPEAVVHDLHPEYLSTKWALGQRDGEPLIEPGFDLSKAGYSGVQHHHAHIASCLVDNDLPGPVIGLALDGTGWGDDGTIWGCEFLVADLLRYRRAGHLRVVPLPGGEASIKEPWRMAAVYLREAFQGEARQLGLAFVGRNAARWAAVLDMARGGVNTLPTSSAGRLFDAAAAVCGVRERVNYEGQAAAEFEQAVDRADRTEYPCQVRRIDGSFVLDGVGLFQEMTLDVMGGASVGHAAAGFHNGLVGALVETCRLISEETGLRMVALSGGTWQNMILLRRTHRLLTRAGFTVLVHHRVPTNDGGIALGQVGVAAARMRAGTWPN